MWPEDDCSESLWHMRLREALAKMRLDPPRVIEEEPAKIVYCTTCDSEVCTCKKEKS